MDSASGIPPIHAARGDCLPIEPATARFFGYEGCSLADLRSPAGTGSLRDEPDAGAGKVTARESPWPGARLALSSTLVLYPRIV